MENVYKKINFKFCKIDIEEDNLVLFEYIYWVYKLLVFLENKIYLYLMSVLEFYIYVDFGLIIIF